MKFVFSVPNQEPKAIIVSKILYGITLIFIFSFYQFDAFCQITMPKVFGNNMVLQRDIDIPVWGKANPGTSITVEIGNEKLSTKTNTDGKWMLRMPKMDAGGPYSMKISVANSSTGAVVFNNVLIGDVWLASGQSNMEWAVYQSMNAEKEIKNADYPNIRLFNVVHEKSNVVKDEIAGGNWQECDSVSVRNASAVAYYFARKLHADVGVPIGILQSTWGGTPVEAWTSREQLLALDITRETVLAADSITPKHFVQDSLDLIRFWEIVYHPQNGADSIFSKENYDDSSWGKIEMPITFKDMGIPLYNGMVWLRNEISIPENMLGETLSINLGHPEMNYSLYFNGKEICKTVWNAELKHEYTIPAEIVKKEKNTIAVRMAFLWGGGGFNPPAEEMYLTDGENNISLSGTWKMKKDLETEIPKIRNYHQYPSYLFNAMIHPLIPFGIKGFIWYQGENNASAARDYQTLFPMLINDWRIRWQQGYLPFLYVQLANYMEKKAEPGESDWAELREAQTMTLSHPNTGMACIIDIGEADDIHPKNKQEVGRRLALLAENTVYNIPVQAYGPMYENHKIEGDKIIIQFKETGSELTIRNGNKLNGFAIAGKDKKFYWATAEIKGEKVILFNEKMKKPAAVRYSWADNPDGNLINSEGLPAVPFRTDNWSSDN